jgi:hypothetical protein
MTEVGHVSLSSATRATFTDTITMTEVWYGKRATSTDTLILLYRW